MAKLKRYILFFLLILIPLFGWYLIAYDIVPPIIWSWQDFANPNYYKELKVEWSGKSTNFLLRKLHSIDIMRFSTAAGIIAKRNERRAIPILVKKVQSNYVDGGIHFSACGVLAIMSPDIAKRVLMEVLNKYKDIRTKSKSYYIRYDNTLLILARMKDERVYPICLDMAKSNNKVERESSLNSMLYYFDNHRENVLPLYLEYLNDKNGSKMAAIEGIKNMKRPETIPILEEFASKNPMYKREAEEAINYIKESQK